MNEAMTPEELLKAENAFIYLHNQGASVERVAEQLGVELKLIEDWKENLEETIKASNYPENLKVTAQEKKKDGSYVFRHNLSFTMSGIEKLKFDLWILINNDKIDKNIITQAEDYQNFVNNYLLSFEYTTEKEGASFNYALKNDTNNFGITNKAIKMCEFYGKYVLRFEHFVENSTLIFNDSTDVYSNYQNIFSYSLKSLAVNEFQGIRFCYLQNIPVDTSWLFISGNNSYGKSTLLRAIAIGLIGSEEGNQILFNDTRSKIGIEYKNSGQNIINNLWTRDFQPLEYLACYGPSRLQIQAKMSQNDIAEKSTTTYGLFNPDGILLNIENKLIEWHLEINDRLNQVKTLFKELIPHLADIIVQKNEQDDYEVLYVEHDEDDETSTFDPVPFQQLAAGFRSIIGLVGDLLIRFIRKQPEVKELHELAGIVLIDELENHLHPKWQYQFPTLLSKVFPNIQFIASTHSVIPILGAPKNSVFLKLDRSKEKGITVERIDIDVANLLPNSILTSPIFDMDTIRPIANENVGQLRTEDTYDEIVANDEIDKQLRELDNDPSQYPALLQ